MMSTLQHGCGSKYTDDFKRKLVAESSADGVSVPMVAQRHGVPDNRIYAWRSDGRFQPVILNVNEGGAPVSSVAITVLCLMVVLGCEWMGLIDIVNMLSIAGQNFLLLYCVAALALLKLSNKVFDRAASIVTVGIVVALIIVEGTTLMYPLVITLLGFAIGARQHTKERAQS